MWTNSTTFEEAVPKEFDSGFSVHPESDAIGHLVQLLKHHSPTGNEGRFSAEFRCLIMDLRRSDHVNAYDVQNV